MKIYADPITINCRKVIAGLKPMDIPYQHEHIDYFQAQQKSPHYLAINPNAALPAMADGEFILWESNAILQYAADKHNKSEFYPTDLQTRADINRWLLWESSSWFPSCYVYMVENCVKPLLQAEPDAAVLAAQDETFHKLAAILDKRLANSEWLGGAGPSIADIAIAAPMHMHSLQQLPLQQHPNLQRWMTERVEQLPCWEATYVGPGFTLERTS